MFNKHIVQPSASAVHADAMFAKDAGKCLRSELTALVGVEYLWRPNMLNASSNRQ